MWEEGEEMMLGAVLKWAAVLGILVSLESSEAEYRKENCAKLLGQADAEIKPFCLSLSKTDLQSKAV